MGFYGNIKNTSRTQFSFDKIYPSRAEMDRQVNLDGIYAGRFVLVEYDENVHMDVFPMGYLKDGIIYASIPSSSQMMVQPYRITPKNEEGEYAPSEYFHIKPGALIYVPAKYNFDNDFFDAEGNPVLEPCDVFFVATSEEKTALDIPYYNFDIQTGTLHDAIDAEGNPMIHPELTYLRFHKFTSGESNYLKNFNIDRVTYGASRGYDSTVWQKVYDRTSAKYVMVAELNSVVPTFDITSDAPSIVPVLPHFDTDSTNVYYKLHWQPQWGLRVKGANSEMETPCLNPNGESQVSTYIKASVDDKEYPSDMFTSWKNNVYNLNTGETTEKVFITNDGNSHSAWIKDDGESFQEEMKIPAAIYFNKAGFAPDKISYSGDKEYKGWTDFLVQDEITLSPTGRSGHQYNSHKPYGPREILPDTQELSVMLPSIGDSMAEIWDLIYGGRNLDAKATTRNMDVSWYNARAFVDKKGTRMVESVGPGQYTYNKAAAGTVAGVMNSVQDLMGMIITDEIPENIGSANGDYIYYDPINKKYLFKHKTYEFEQQTFNNNTIPDDYVEYEPIKLGDWDKSHYYVDTALQSAYEFIMEDKFYKDRKYVLAGNVENAMEEVHLSAEYKTDGSFYLLKSDKYSNPDGSKGATYDYFVGSTEAHQDNTNYYELVKASDDKQLQDGEAIYVPNTYYYIQYIKVGLTNLTYEPNVYYYIHHTDDMNGADGKPISVPYYVLATAENMEDNLDSLGYSASDFYKRTYTLDTNLKKSDVLYYTVKPQEGQSSNAYYKQTKTAIPTNGLAYENYTAKMYYYISQTMPEDENAKTEVIGNVIYIRDDKEYTLEEYTAANREYFTIEIEYELVEGKDIIEITDENAIPVNKMRDMSEFKYQNFESGVITDLFYIWADEAGTMRYIEVNYNNFNKAWNPATQQYEFVVMNYSLMGEPYHASGFYYRIEDTDNPKHGSYLIDTSSEITPNRTYYKFTPIKNVNYDGEFLTGYFTEGEYYIEYPKDSGNFIPATEANKDTVEDYFDPTLKLYVMSDSNGIYTEGAVWPITVKKIPDGVILGTRHDVWEFSELPGFADKISTLHGLLLRLHNYLNEKDDLTRDTTTARGTVNLFNDLIQRFSALVPGQFTIVDDYGRMHSAQHSTAQPLTFTALSSVQEGSWNKAAEENILLTIGINSDWKTPSISITHTNANIIDNTQTSFDMNDREGFAGVDTFDIETPLIDNAGHIVGKNTHTITLPNGFKKISLENSVAVGDLSTNETQIIADNSQDTLTFASKNKWIRVASENNVLNIAHAIVGENYGELKDNAQDYTPAFGATFKVPVITVDNAGHLTAITTETVKIPGLTYQEDATAEHDVVLNINYNYDSTNDVGQFVETRGKVDELIIQDYNITNGSDTKLAATDKIHVAFAKLQAQINAMDLSQIGGTEGDYITTISESDGKVVAVSAKLPSVTDNAVTGQFVSSVSEKFGQIAISRLDFEPSIVLTSGTDTDAPAINVVVNTKQGVAQSLNKATLSAYGVTKLTNTYSSTSTDLAMTGAGVNAAFKTLAVDGESSISAAQTIKSWNEKNGIITIETQDILISDDNIADDAKIQMTKIDGLNDSLLNILGTEESDSNTFTVYGLSKRIDGLVGDAENDTADSFTMYGLSKKSDNLLGSETDDATQKTIYGLLAKIAELEARINEEHPVVEETPPEDENGDEITPPNPEEVTP
jgi:hypothetical protein